MLYNIFFVGIGGFLGAICRYLSVHIITVSFGVMPYYGTLTVNTVGSFIAGIFLALPFEFFGANLRLLCVTGFLGGFTTFSAFSIDTLLLFKSGNIITGFTNIILNIILSIGSAVVGVSIVRLLIGIKAGG